MSDIFITDILRSILGILLEKNEAKSDRRILTQICLVCGAENRAGEAFCKKCGQPLGTPQLSRTRKTLEIVAMFAIFIVLMFVVFFVILSLR